LALLKSMRISTEVPELDIRQRAEPAEIRIARSIAEIEALRECWSNWPGHRDSDIDFYLMILNSYPDVVRPHVVVLYRDGEPESILIGRLEKKHIAFNIGYLRLPRVRARCLTFVYGAIHGKNSAENIKLLVHSILDSLDNEEADLAFLEFVPLGSSLYGLALNLPGVFGRDILPSVQAHHLLAVPQRIEDVYCQMSAKHRKNLRREIKHLLGGTAKARIVCFRDECELGRLFQDAEAIARTTYQRGLGTGFADNALIRKRLELGARKGWLRAHLLYISDRPVAFWIGMLYNHTFISEYLGYDPEFRRLSPGMVLIMKVIEDFSGQTDGGLVTELDFGLGDAEYKAALCSKTWLEAPVHIFSSTPRGLLLKFLRLMTRTADVCARKVLTSTNMLPKLRRIWRDRLSRHEQHQQLPGEAEIVAVAPSEVPPSVAN